MKNLAASSGVSNKIQNNFAPQVVEYKTPSGGIKDMLLDALIYFVDRVCTEHAVVHLVFGVFFGFLLGHSRPSLAFWSAALIGFSKETIDYFKHAHQMVNFNYLTDYHYGILDGYSDWFFWLLGGYLSYRLLRRGHGVVRKKYLSFINSIHLQPAEVELSPSDARHRSVHWESHR